MQGVSFSPEVMIYPMTLLPKVNVCNDTKEREENRLGQDKVLELGIQIAIPPCSEQMTEAQGESRDDKAQHEMCSRLVCVDDGEEECQRYKDQDGSSCSLFNSPLL